jgi:hypothetical protein
LEFKKKPNSPPFGHDDPFNALGNEETTDRASKTLTPLTRTSLMINKDKSAIMFSLNTWTIEKEEVTTALQIEKETMSERYLGLLVYVGRDKTKGFQFFKERVWQRIQGWNEKLLSKAGKEVLIKAVAQTIPTCAMASLYESY